ncbi:MAG: hypothetical protein R2695_06715 [Acidimicrobiales bacterium]
MSTLTVDGESHDHEFPWASAGHARPPGRRSAARGRHPDVRRRCGVDPICTAEPCPVPCREPRRRAGRGRQTHDPQHRDPRKSCQTATCGPVVDLRIEAPRDDLHIIHAEVYVDPQNDPGVSPARPPQP